MGIEPGAPSSHGAFQIGKRPQLKTSVLNVWSVLFLFKVCTCLNQYFSGWLGFKGAFNPFVTQGCGCRTFPGVLERALRQPYLANGWALSCKSWTEIRSQLPRICHIFWRFYMPWCPNPWRCFKAACGDMLDVLKFGNAAMNAFFRSLYRNRIWLSREQASTAVQNCWNMTDSCLHLL